MRNLCLFPVIIFSAIAIIGCEPKSSSSKVADQKMAIAKEKIAEASSATDDAIKAKRTEAAADLQKKFDVLDDKYQQLVRRASDAKGDVKKDLDEKLKVAKVKRDLAAKRLDELKTSSNDRWEKVKDSVGDAFEDLKKAFD